MEYYDIINITIMHLFGVYLNISYGAMILKFKQFDSAINSSLVLQKHYMYMYVSLILKR